MTGRIAYGARCLWWGSIDDVGRKTPSGESGHGIPCCPYCGGVLFETDAEEWDENVRRFDERHPGYSDYVEWGTGKCFPTASEKTAAYAKETGKAVPWSTPG